jgi:uncharacterized protein (DUF1684 family)
MKLITTALLFITCQIQAQDRKTYIDSIQDFRNHYVSEHDVVKGADQKFIEFFPIDPAYRVEAKFEHIANGNWFQMNTSGKEKKTYRKYGKLSFLMHGNQLSLFVYQSQSLMNDKEYRNYLFIPFTDATSGVDSYGGGRYLDYTIEDIKQNLLEIDFNKAYNPYCAYSSGYNCPIPPKENDLAEPIRAGEMNFGHPKH